MKTPLSWVDANLTVMCEKLSSEFTKVTSEDIRYWLKSRRMKAPSGVFNGRHMYGGLMRKAIAVGLLKPTETFKTIENSKKARVYKVSKKKISI